MRAAAVLRSGGRPFFYPKTVWSPAGGWHADPGNWRSAAATAAAAIAVGQAICGRRAAVEGGTDFRECGHAYSVGGKAMGGRAFCLFAVSRATLDSKSPPLSAGAFCTSLISSANEVRIAREHGMVSVRTSALSPRAIVFSSLCPLYYAAATCAADSLRTEPALELARGRRRPFLGPRTASHIAKSLEWVPFCR
jgi:hypothetical protein